MRLYSTNKILLMQLAETLQQFKDEEYKSRLNVLLNASIGEHVRHILEFYTCLIKSKETGIISYDKRVRKKEIEQQVQLAIATLHEIIEQLHFESPSAKLSLEASFTSQDTEPQIYSSTIERELIYCLEHAIHHMAIIRIGIQQCFAHIRVEKNFGIAPSTVKYKSS